MNVTLTTAAVALLVLTPTTVSYPIRPRESVLLAAGLAAVLFANLILLRVTLRPLTRLAELMDRIDLLRPGARLKIEGARELNVVLETFNAMLERLEQERRSSSSRSTTRQEEERRRLATELHDEIGQGLTALLLQLKTALADAPPELRDRLVEAQRIARGNLDETRRIARQLRPTMLDDLGLASALHSLADAAEEQGGLEVERRIDPDVPRLPQETELAVYRICQEALTNIVRHAGASKIELVLETRDHAGQAALEIHDDGRGMIYAAVAEGGGIRGMRERAMAIGGDFGVISRPGEGTTVELSVPLRP